MSKILKILLLFVLFLNANEANLESKKLHLENNFLLVADPPFPGRIRRLPRVLIRLRA